MDVTYLSKIALKHVTKVSIVFVAVVTALTVIIFFQKPVYEATAAIMFKNLKDGAPTAVVRREHGKVSMSVTQDQLINNEILILKSNELAEKVIQEVRLQRLYPELVKAPHPLEQAVSAFQTHLAVKVVPKSNIVTVAFQHGDADVAARCVNLLLESFKNKHIAIHSALQSSFIDSQFVSSLDSLNRSQRNLQEYQEKYDAFSLDTQRSVRLQQLSEFEAAYKMAAGQVAETQAKIQALKAQESSLANGAQRYTPTGRDQIVLEARAKQLEAELKEQEIRRKYRDNNRLAVEARNQKQLIDSFLKEQEQGIAEKVKGASPVYQQWELDLIKAEADLSSQVERADALRKQVRQLESELSALDGKDLQLQNLKRQLGMSEKTFSYLAERLEEARVAEASNARDLSDVSFIQLAVPPAEPKEADKALKVVVALLVGLISAVTCAYLCERTM